MAFWGGQGNAMVDPKRSFRWLVTFGTKHNKLHDWYAKSANKPSFTVGETPHRFVNHTFFYPGRVEWQTIDIVLSQLTQKLLLGTLKSWMCYNPDNISILAH